MTEKQLLLLITNHLNLNGMIQNELLSQLILLTAGKGADVDANIENYKHFAKHLNDYSRILTKATEIIYDKKEDDDV